MPLDTDPIPHEPRTDDPRVVVVEVAADLHEIDQLRILDARGLAGAWMRVHHCDAAVLGSLDHASREHYQAIAARRRPRAERTPRWSDRNAVRAGVAHLKVAVHRRLIVLDPVVRRTPSDAA
jgi:hypothetical protein